LAFCIKYSRKHLKTCLADEQYGTTKSPWSTWIAELPRWYRLTISRANSVAIALSKPALQGRVGQRGLTRQHRNRNTARAASGSTGLSRIGRTGDCGYPGRGHQGGVNSGLDSTAHECRRAIPDVDHSGIQARRIISASKQSIYAIGVFKACRGINNRLAKPALGQCERPDNREYAIGMFECLATQQ